MNADVQQRATLAAHDLVLARDLRRELIGVQRVEVENVLAEVFDAFGCRKYGILYARTRGRLSVAGSQAASPARRMRQASMRTHRTMPLPNDRAVLFLALRSTLRACSNTV